MNISPFQQHLADEKARLTAQLEYLKTRTYVETRSVPKPELNADALERIDKLKTRTFAALAQINRDSMERLDDATIQAKAALDHLLTISPPEQDLWDMGLTLLDDPRSCVEQLLGRGDKPTAVWALSIADSTSTAYQLISPEGNVLRSFRSKREAQLWMSYCADPPKLRIVETTRSKHNGVHWDTCDPDCDVAHGWIEIGAHPVDEFDQDDRYTRTFAVDRMEAFEDMEDLDAL